MLFLRSAQIQSAASPGGRASALSRA
jgi:hypothetical protein